MKSSLVVVLLLCFVITIYAQNGRNDRDRDRTIWRAFIQSRSREEFLARIVSHWNCLLKSKKNIFISNFDFWSYLSLCHILNYLSTSAFIPSLQNQENCRITYCDENTSCPNECLMGGLTCSSQSLCNSELYH